MFKHLQRGNWSRNSSRKCFWDSYWGRAGQLLANFFLSLGTVLEVFGTGNSAQFFFSLSQGWEKERSEGYVCGIFVTFFET